MGGGCYWSVYGHGLLLGRGGRTIIGSWGPVGRILDCQNEIRVAFIWVGCGRHRVNRPFSKMAATVLNELKLS